MVIFYKSSERRRRNTLGNGNEHYRTVRSKSKGVTTIMTDDKFCSLYGLQLKAGRFFNISDTSAVSIQYRKVNAFRNVW